MQFKFSHRNAFIWSPIQEDVKTIPGIGYAGEVCLGNALGDGPVRTTFDIIRTFVSLHTPQMTTQDLYTAIVRWLCVKGISKFRNDIVVAVASKTCLLVVIVGFLRHRHLGIDPPE